MPKKQWLPLSRNGWIRLQDENTSEQEILSTVWRCRWTLKTVFGTWGFAAVHRMWWTDDECVRVWLSSFIRQFVSDTIKPPEASSLSLCIPVKSNQHLSELYFPGLLNVLTNYSCWSQPRTPPTLQKKKSFFLSSETSVNVKLHLLAGVCSSDSGGEGSR